LPDGSLIVRPPATATEQVAAGPKTHLWWRRISRWQEPLLVAILVVGAGEALIRGGLITSSQLPPPSVIAQAFFEDIQHAEVWEALESTMLAWAIGLAGVIITGVPLGMALGGIAAGFVLGSLLPATRTEEERLGPVASQAREQVSDLASDALDHGKQVAQDAAQAATDTVKDSSVEHAQQLTDEAKQAASETASQART